MAAIYKRELKSYFYSMTGCIFIAFMTLFLGIYFMSYNLGSGYPYFSFSLTGMLSIMMFSIPVLTMRSLSDERRSRTDQLLLTSPVSVTGIVLGKYLSMITVFAATVLVAALCPLIIMANGTAYLAADYASLLAYFLLGCVYISIGLFLSSLTESQIIAAVFYLRRAASSVPVAQPYDVSADNGIWMCRGLFPHLDSGSADHSPGNGLGGPGICAGGGRCGSPGCPLFCKAVPSPSTASLMCWETGIYRRVPDLCGGSHPGYRRTFTVREHDYFLYFSHRFVRRKAQMELRRAL